MTLFSDDFSIIGTARQVTDLTGSVTVNKIRPAQTAARHRRARMMRVGR